MSKCNSFEDASLDHILNNAAIANIGDATGLDASTTDGSLYVALFTADPTETGAFTNEATFGAYARQAVARTGAQWTISGTAPTQATNAALIAYTECTSGSETITHVGICKSLSGTGASEMLYQEAVDTSRAVSTGVTLEFAIGAITITED